MSLTHNPNYGEAQIGTDGDNFIDLTPTKVNDKLYVFSIYTLTLQNVVSIN